MIEETPKPKLKRQSLEEMLVVDVDVHQHEKPAAFARAYNVRLVDPKENYSNRA